MKSNITRTLLRLLVIICIPSLLILVILFFLNNSCYTEETLGQFGSFYGGLIGTIAAVLAGILLFITYRTSKRDSDSQIVNRLFDNIVQDINNLQFRVQNDKDWKIRPKDKQEFYAGIDAIYNFSYLHEFNPNSVLNHLNSIIDSFIHIVDLAETKIRYNHIEMKEMTLRRIYLLYYSRILWPVWELEYPKKENPNKAKGLLSKLIKSKHDDSIFIFRKYAEFSIKTIEYLSDCSRELIEKKPDKIEKLKKLIH